MKWLAWTVAGVLGLVALIELIARRDERWEDRESRMSDQPHGLDIQAYPDWALVEDEGSPW